MTFSAFLKHWSASFPFALKAYHAAGSLSRAVLYRLSPRLLALARYRAAWKSWPDLRDPRSFDEKLLWLNLYWKDPLKAVCGDKYGIRGYADGLGLGGHMPVLYGVYDRPEDIDLEALPDKFVLKCSHGCKYNIFCRDKCDFDAGTARRLLAGWMKKDYSVKYGEAHYADMKPRIICEEFLEEPGVELPSDYKVYCFAGRVHCTMSCTQRQSNGLAKYSFYDRDWKVRLPYNRNTNMEGRDVPKPGGYEEMIGIAEKLSKPFPFVRVDFYSIAGRVVIGEMTFTPSACVDPNYTAEAEKKLGGLIVLPDKT